LEEDQATVKGAGDEGRRGPSGKEFLRARRGSRASTMSKGEEVEGSGCLEGVPKHRKGEGR
jgi:hypothetical protein